MQLSTPGNVVPPPRGIHETKVDEKGRLKLTAIFQKYLEAFGQRDVFCTSLDNVIARVYPIPTWMENEKIFAQRGENATKLGHVQFQAAKMGADSVMDDAGRVLLPQKLRQPLKLEGATVYLQVEKGAISVYSEEAIAKRDAEVQANLTEDLAVGEAAGIR